MKTTKIKELLDGNGNKLNRKIRKDLNGLYIINKGRRGAIKKTITTSELLAGHHIIYVTRKVDYYTEL